MLNRELKERIISTYNEGDCFLIYFDGTTYYDEDPYGKPNPKENHLYLDKDFNIWEMNINRNDADALARMKSIELGFKFFVGPHSPEIEVVKEVKEKNGRIVFKEVMVSNTDPDTVGIWRETTDEEKNKFISLLIRQNEQRSAYRLRMKMNKDE